MPMEEMSRNRAHDEKEKGNGKGAPSSMCLCFGTVPEHNKYFIPQVMENACEQQHLQTKLNEVWFGKIGQFH